MKITYPITLSLYANDVKRLEGAKQGDAQSREFEVTLTDRTGEIFKIPAGASAQYSITKPDGHTVVHLATVKGDKVSFVLADQALIVPGTVTGDVTLTLDDGTVLSSQRYTFECEPTDRNMKNIDSTSEYGAITKIVKEAAGYKDAAASSAEAAKSFATAASASVDTVRKIEAEAKTTKLEIEGHATSAAQSAKDANDAAARAAQSKAELDESVAHANEALVKAEDLTSTVNASTVAASKSEAAASQSAASAAESLTQAKECQRLACECKAGAEEAQRQAGLSQTAAASSAATATEKASEAETAAASARGTVTQVEASASKAASSALEAEGSASRAEQLALQASGSKDAAAQSAITAGNAAQTAQLSATKAEEEHQEVIKIRDGIVTAEGQRAEAEGLREAAEITRESVEKARQDAEQQRALADQERQRIASEDHQKAVEDQAQHAQMIETIRGLESGQLVKDVADIKLNMANKDYVDGRFEQLIGAAPEALDTLGELAAALGGQADFATQITAQMAEKASKAELGEAVTAAKTGLQTQIDTKASKSDLAGGLAGKVDSSTYETDKNATDAALAKKVDRVSGKGLSSEDYTAAEKSQVGKIGTLATLKTTVKTSLVEAINELEARPNTPVVDVPEASSKKAISAGWADGFQNQVVKIDRTGKHIGKFWVGTTTQYDAATDIKNDPTALVFIVEE